MRFPATLLLLSSLLQAEEIPAGTRFLLRAEQSVSTRTAKTGDRVRFRTVFPAVDGDRVVVPPGTYVDTEVALVKKSKWVGGRGQLILQALRIVLPNGKVYPIDALGFAPFPATAMRLPRSQPELRVAGVFAGLYTLGVAAYGSTKDKVVIGVIDAGLLATALTRRGTEIEIQEGMEVSAFLDRAVPLD